MKAIVLYIIHYNCYAVKFLSHRQVTNNCFLGNLVDYVSVWLYNGEKYSFLEQNSMDRIKSVGEFNSKIKRVLISEEEIKAAVKAVGKKISDSFDGKPILLVSILNGAFVFMADLCREITVPCEVAFMCAKSYYNGTDSSGIVNITMDLEQDISGYHVIIVEDIVDTGRTLNDVVNLLKSRNPLSLRVVTLLDKPSRRLVDFEPDESLFVIEDLFVIGYGLDCGGYYRNLPYIAEYNQQ